MTVCWNKVLFIFVVIVSKPYSVKYINSNLKQNIKVGGNVFKSYSLSLNII